jgi:membrane-bound lytic murein transglycosylase D
MSRWWRAALLAALTGCGTMRSVPVEEPPAATPVDVPRLLPTDLRAPEVRHQRTIAWMRRLCDDDARVASSALDAIRMARAVPRLKAILAEEGVPPEMVAVPVVESGLRPHARGRHGERGIWQIRPATARHLGLRVSAKQDDRLHLERSTRAAARYLARLHRRYGTWPLALAAYNAGEGRVNRALARHPKAAFWELADRRALPPHSRSYVPRVLAMMELLATPEACRRSTFAARRDEPTRLSTIHAR